MDFTTTEQTEGVRFIWNNLPTSRLTTMKNIIPISMLYSPFFQREDPITKVENAPLYCSSCGWVANPFCPIDYTTMKFDCVNCKMRCSLPSYYKSIVSEGYPLQEFQAQNTVCDYTVHLANEDKKPFLFFVVDTSMPENELKRVQDALVRNIEKLGNVYVGILSIGKHVFLHNLQSAFLSETIIGGNVEYTKDQLLNLLKLKTANPSQHLINKYIQPLDNCKDRLLKIIKRLRPNTFEVKKDKRSLRCVGQGLLTALCCIESFGGFGGRIVSLLGGATTIGSGKIISDELAVTFRNHTDLLENSDLISVFQKAKNFYDSLIKPAVNYSVTIDLFAFCLNQFGIGEMRNLIEKTGGLVVNQEEFICEVFDKSFDKYINVVIDPNSPYSSKMKVLCSKDLFLSGFLGPAHLSGKDPSVPKDADGLIGQSGGNEFQTLSPLSTSTYLMFFSHRQAEMNIKSKPCYFQIKTTFINTKGETIIRVSTFMREFINDEKMILSGFDQEAGMACLARLAGFKGEIIETQDLIYWLNSVLIKFIRRYANFQQNDPKSFSIPDEISLLPQFMYYFRKSYFVQKFGTSVDEHALFKMTLNRENLSNMLVMIQPALFAYDLETQQPNPVFCDINSLKPDIIILVDTYFNVLIWHGKLIHEWVEQEYHLMDDYQHLKTLLELPKEDADLIVEDRLPVPMVISCHSGSPQERILKSKLNPSSDNNVGGDDEDYITDDVSMKKFMDYLIKLVVKKN